jgi:hypothetical protein
MNVSTDDAEWTTKIDRLASRLGVKPEPAESRGDGQLRYLLSVNNGNRSYNLLDLVGAALDRCDAAVELASRLLEKQKP